MNVLEDFPHLCLNFLILPLPKRFQLVELLKQKLVALRVLNNFWLEFDQNLTSKPDFFKNDSSYSDAVREARQHLFQYLGRVIKLQKSLNLVIPAMQNFDQRVSKLLARVNYDCLIFANTLVPRVLVNLETF